MAQSAGQFVTRCSPEQVQQAAILCRALWTTTATVGRFFTPQLDRRAWRAVWTTSQSLSGASFTTVTQLQQHIDAFFIRAYSGAPRPVDQEKVHQRRFKGRRMTQLCSRVLEVQMNLQILRR